MLSPTPDSYHRSKHRGSTQLAPEFATSEYSDRCGASALFDIRSIALHTDGLHTSLSCSEVCKFVLFRGPNADEAAKS
jgi:hypothetical protein